MPAKSESQARIFRRTELARRIAQDSAIVTMPACLRCKKAGSECVVAPNVNTSCARCIRLGCDSSCDVFMSFKECKFHDVRSVVEADL